MTTTYQQADIEKATSMSIIDVVESLGYPLKKTGKSYSHGSNYKLRVYPESNSYYDFSQGIGGNTINFVQRHLDTTFPKAMDYLLNGNYHEAEHKEVKKEPFNYYFPDNSDTKKGKDYLINERKLDPVLVNFLFDKQKIRMDKLNQLIFPWQKNNVIVGATVRGTTYDPKKFSHGYYIGIASNSESNFTYNISIGNPDKLYIFESPIDLLSYWSMNKDLKNVTFASLNGSKDVAVFNTLNYLAENKCKIKDIYICSDNDRVGQVLYQKVDLGYENINFHKEIPDDLMIPKECMELYNEVLKEKQSVIAPELLAAIHKTETNLSMTNECASKEELVFYFGKRLNLSKENPSEYTREEMKERIGCLVDDLEKTRIGEHISIKKTLQERLKETLPNENFNEKYLWRLEDYHKRYLSLDRLIIGPPVKDWNEKLQQIVEQREQVQQALKEVTKTKVNVEKPKKEETKDLKKTTTNFDQTYINEERKQTIRVQGSEELVIADIFQTGQYAGSLEPSSPEEMDKLIKSYGFEAIDKEDYAKYTHLKEAQRTQSKEQETELILE